MSPCPAALYIRLSREDGDREESDSVANQRKLLTEFLNRKEDLCLGDVYVDDGFTGTNFQRPAFRRMLEAIEEGRIRCVIVKDLSRFGRDYIDTGRYLERYFPEKGVRFISVSDGIDSREKDYDMLLPIKNIFNEQYARDISRKIRATFRTKQKAGEFIGAFPSYGYRKSAADRNRLEIDPYPAAVVRRIFGLYLEGRGKQEIADLLNREGILSPSAYKASRGMRYVNPRCSGQSSWTCSTINSILHREMYAGNMVQGTRKQKMRGKQTRVDRKDWIIVENTHEPVVDPVTWGKAQRLLEKRKRIAGPCRRENILAGFLKCGDCGSVMVRNTWEKAGGQQASVYYCGGYKRYGKTYCTSHAVPEEVLLQVIGEDLRQTVQAAGNCTEAAEEEAQEARQENGRLQGELDRIRRMKQAVYEDRREGILSEEEFFAYREDYRNREKFCLERIRELEEKCRDSGEEDRGIPAVLDSGAWIPDRETLAETVAEITVYADHRIRICYRFSGEYDPCLERQ